MERAANMQRLAAFAVTLTLAALACYLVAGDRARAAGMNPDAFSIDMDPAGAPANTATSLGSRQTCAGINANNILDADEDATADTLAVDVTVTNIPAFAPMIAFNYVLNYNETALSVQTADHNFLLQANGAAQLFDASEPLPDNDNNGIWQASVLDVNIIPETGSGVLTRLTISSDASAVQGVYLLTVTDAVILDPASAANQPDAINNAAIAVNQPCPTLIGDVDCNGSVSAVDALKVLRYVVGLSVAQESGCPLIGTGTPYKQGDVDCNESVTAVDALKILRYVAGLSVTQPGCPPIGS